MNVPVVGILRGVPERIIGKVMSASFDAGLQALEVTMNTEGAAAMVEENRGLVPEGSFLGMGTVRNVKEARIAVGAGAMFVVTPNLDFAVIEYVREQGIPIIAGAFTPTEVHAAWDAGADMVKVFPCGPVGPGYIRDLRGPFEGIPLVAVGGVNVANVATYFAAGAFAVGVGSSLFGKDALSSGNGEAIKRNVEGFLAHCPRR